MAVYFMQPVGGGAVKIGHSGDVDARRRQLEAHYGQPLALLGTVKGGREKEREIHERFAHLRFGRTEQFVPDRELMEFIGRPLLVSPNPDAVEAIEPQGKRTVLAMKGSEEWGRWLADISERTMIPTSRIVDVALKEWAARNGHPAPPKR